MKSFPFRSYGIYGIMELLVTGVTKLWKSFHFFFTRIRFGGQGPINNFCLLSRNCDNHVNNQRYPRNEFSLLIPVLVPRQMKVDKELYTLNINLCMNLTCSYLLTGSIIVIQIWNKKNNHAYVSGRYLNNVSYLSCIIWYLCHWNRKFYKKNGLTSNFRFLL